MSEINMTPLIDVMLVLLVIFIITAPLMVSAVRVDVPSAQGAQTAAGPSQVAVVVDKAGQLYVDDQPLAPSALAQRFAEAALRDPGTEVMLRADASVPYGRVLEVMGLARKAGLERIGFVAQPLAPPAH